MARVEDIRAIRDLENAWCDAWNSHNMEALTKLLLPGGDFVTVGGRWLRGRREFKAHTGLLHKTQFKHSTFRVTATHIRFLKSDLALTHARWRLVGDFDPDGTPRKPRRGIFTQVLQKSRGRWLILASQNTNNAKLPVKAVRELLKSRKWD